MLGKKRSKKIEEQVGSGRRSYRPLFWRRFRKNRPAVWSLRVLYLLLFIAIFADFIANDKPIYCRIDGEDYFPVFRQYAVDAGLSSWEARFVQADWRDLEYDRVIYPLIPYAAGTIDRRNMNARSPFEEQLVPSRRFHHWLGTDGIGRDIAAGMIRGTRVALSVGLVAMGIATLIGLCFGALAGYFGDHGLRVTRSGFWCNLLGLALGLFYGFQVRGFALREGALGWELLKSFGILLIFMLVFNMLARGLQRFPLFGKDFSFPADMLVMRLIEIINSIPGLLLILSVVAVVRRPSIFYVMIIIGAISWTSIAKFVRAELLRIRRAEYIEAARVLGYSHRRILFRHALPNAMTPVLITVAFGIAGAILLEASLSFLGIGLSAGSVTWGSLLSAARYNTSAWWLAVFPGLAIFVTVTIFNLLGEGLTEALEPSRKAEGGSGKGGKR
jgi:peptide/nickel transport system permease protein